MANPSRTRAFKSVAQVAKEIEVSQWFIRDEIERGHLIAHQFGNRYRITEADFEAYLQRTRGARNPNLGRPPKERTSAK